MSLIHIIGAGLSGATLARLLAEQGYDVHIYEMEEHVGGNCYDYFNKYGILVQKYGPHIFHTDKKYIYDFLKRFIKFQPNPVNVLVNIKNTLTDMPINFKSIDTFFPNDALSIKKFINSNWKKRKSIPINELLECEHASTKEWAEFIFKNVYENYSSKMWGIPINQLDLNVLKRVQVIPNYQHNYFPNDQYQGMPIGGFTKMIENILKHKAIKLIKKKPLIRLSNNRVYLNKKVTKDPVFYCGQIDELLNYRYGQIPYRSLHFKFVDKKVNSFQSASVINYPSHPTLTRIAEYKKINNQRIKGITTISYEYPGNYDTNSVKWNKPYYPIHNEINNAKYQQYANELSKYDNFYLLGRLAEYKYFDMDDAIQNAMNKFKDFIKNN